MRNRHETTYARISAILFVGSFCAAALLALGLGMLLLGNHSQDDLAGMVGSYSTRLSALLNGEPLAILSLGILVMMLTPFLRVAAAVLSFTQEKDFKYAAVGFGVMAILLFTILPSLF